MLSSSSQLSVSPCSRIGGMLTLRAHTFLQTETEMETLEGMMERQVDLIGKLVKLDNIREVLKSTVTIFKQSRWHALTLCLYGRILTWWHQYYSRSYIPVLDMIKLRRLHVGSNQSRLRHVIDHVTFEFLQEPWKAIVDKFSILTADYKQQIDGTMT